MFKGRICQFLTRVQNIFIFIYSLSQELQGRILQIFVRTSFIDLSLLKPCKKLVSSPFKAIIRTCLWIGDLYSVLYSNIEELHFSRSGLSLEANTIQWRAPFVNKVGVEF